MKRDVLLNHFSQFGNVQNVRIHKKATHSFGFVTFTKPESASKALAIRFHFIAGHSTDVSIADSWHQEKPLELRNNHEDAVVEPSSPHVLPIELTNVTGTHLLDLNDDCLYEVFSLKFNRLMDLCSVAECSTRLKQIANRIFTASHKICHLNSLSLSTIHELRRLLLNFGPLVSELWMEPPFLLRNKWERPERVMDLVIRYCGKTLESLILIDYEINSYLAVKLKPLFNRLEKLVIKDCNIDGDMQLFANCKSMVELKLNNFTSTSDYVGMIFENTFPKLERFKYKEDYNDYDDYNLDVFISRHKNLKTFSLKRFDEDSTSLLAVIAENCKQLEKLQIRGDYDGPINKVEFENALKSLISLEQLKKLKINCSNENVTKFTQELNALKSLELLELWNARADAEFIPALSQMKHLHVLRLHYCKDLKNLNPLGDLEQLTQLSIRLQGESENIDFNTVQIIKRLTNLKTLIIEWNKFKFDKRMYLRIVDIVRERQGIPQTCLEIKCDSIDDDVADLQFDQNNHHIVKLGSADDSGEFTDETDSDDDFDYSDDYDDDDDDVDHFVNPFLLHMLNPQWLFRYPPSSDDDDYDVEFSDSNDDGEESEVW